MIDPDLFSAVFCALETAQSELEALRDADVEWPPTDDMVTALRERKAALSTLKRIRDGYTAQGKPAVVERIKTVFNEEMAKQRQRTPQVEMPPAPVDAEVMATIGDALERVRRAAILDRDVRDAVEAGTLTA